MFFLGLSMTGKSSGGDMNPFLLSSPSPPDPTHVVNQFSGCASVDVTDMGFSDTIITPVASVGDSTAGSSDWDCRIWSGKVTCGTIAFTDKSFALLFPVNVCWEIVRPEFEDMVAARLDSMLEITVTWTSPKGSGLTTTSLFGAFTWCICTTGVSGRCAPSKVWAIAAGPKSKLHNWTDLMLSL